MVAGFVCPGVALSSSRGEGRLSAETLGRGDTTPGALSSIDPYANSFMADLSAPPLEWSLKDKTDMKPGVGERKYELDSLCYPIRLAHGYWKATGDTSPFDARWKKAMRLVLQTMRVQQRKEGPGPYRFQRSAENPTDTLVNGIGNPVKPVGLIASCFRPSDDACIFSFLVPSNLFAVTSLRQLAEMAETILNDAGMAAEARALAKEVETALRQYAIVDTRRRLNLGVRGGRLRRPCVDG